MGNSARAALRGGDEVFQPGRIDVRPAALVVPCLAHLVGRPTRDHDFAEDAARIVVDWRASMAPLVEKDTAPITVERLCTEVTHALPVDGVLVADTGYSGIWTGTMIEMNGAGQTYLRAAGSLG